MIKTVSIIVPVYNAEKFLGRCVESLLEQTYTAIEILLVDDGSRDGSAEICQEFCRKDARVRYLYKENGGVASARNFGIENASGEYLLFVDSDDFVAPQTVDLLLRHSTEVDADLAICSYLVLTIREEILRSFGEGVYIGRGAIAKLLDEKMGDSILHACWGKLYKRAAITEMQDPFFPIGEDWVFNVVNLKNVQTIALVDEPLYYYECRNQSITRSKYKLNSEIIDRMHLTILHELRALYHSEGMLAVIRLRHLNALVGDAQKTSRSLRVLNQRLHEIKREHAETINGLDCHSRINRYIKRRGNVCLIAHLLFRSVTAYCKEIVKKYLSNFSHKARRYGRN